MTKISHISWGGYDKGGYDKGFYGRNKMITLSILPQKN